MRASSLGGSAAWASIHESSQRILCVGQKQPSSIVARATYVRSNFCSIARNTACEHLKEAKVAYPFHPRHGEIVLVKRRLTSHDVELVVIYQPDGSLTCLPVWMLDESAGEYTTCEDPGFSLKILWALRTEIDALLADLHPYMTRTKPITFTTSRFARSSSWLFGASSYQAAPMGPLHLSHSITLARLLDKTPSRYSKIYWAVWKYEFEFVKLNIPNPEQLPIGPNTLIGDNVRFIQSTWLRVASLGLRRASLAKGHGEQRQMRPVRYDSIDEQTSPFWGFTRIYQAFALLYNLARVRGARLMKRVLAISASIVAIMTILAFGEPTIQRSIGDGARAQHSTKVRDQACYRRCRNDMRKPTSACNRLCRSSRD
jgi:hypothetical protein